MLSWFKKRAWHKAQQKEFLWWQGVSKDGYAEQSPEDFISNGQKTWMLKQLRYLEYPIEHWKNKVVVEFGPGPAGIVEYLEANRKFGVEPLYKDYLSSFPHLQNSDVVYLAKPAEANLKLESNMADLSICFNVLDHVYSPRKVLRNIFRITKADGDILFQVNVFKSAAEAQGKSGLHAELHPHSFTEDSITRLLNNEGFFVVKKRISEDTNPEGELFLLMHLKKKLAS